MHHPTPLRYPGNNRPIHPGGATSRTAPATAGPNLYISSGICACGRLRQPLPGGYV